MSNSKKVPVTFKQSISSMDGSFANGQTVAIAEELAGPWIKSGVCVPAGNVPVTPDKPVESVSVDEVSTKAEAAKAAKAAKAASSKKK